MTNNELYHFGVKGMKWGVRRKSRSQSSGGAKGLSVLKKKAEEPSHDDYTNRHTKKSIKSMSDQELRERINRLQMEDQYRKLTSTQTRIGRTVVGGILANSAKQSVSGYVTRTMTKGLEELIKAKTAG